MPQCLYEFFILAMHIYLTYYHTNRCCYQVKEYQHCHAVMEPLRRHRLPDATQFESEILLTITLGRICFQIQIPL
ncbi:hypothetical protein DSO57_1004292 [Entomophthora muscae]|uniref:Uncharacterized protein n=1 Tax=Entomophthora muscae TaxID=34485 RepID=A0ACC2TVM7_9FUNG|nr:hypothetical protein DSO57_1004292 [Entomophthora muscae]